MFQLQRFLNNRNDGFSLEEICRLCRNSKGVMSYIFNTSGIDNTGPPLSARIMSFVNIDISEGDGLPALICHRCLYQVEQSYEFRLLCEQSDNLLRQYIKYQMEDNAMIKPDILSQPIQCNGSAAKNGFASDEDCQAKSDAENGVEDEETSVESEEMYGFNCPTCNKGFDVDEALERHKLIHTQDGPFPCDYCTKVVPDKASLRVHWRQEHSGNKSHMCQTCGESFENRENLLKHNERHDKMKPYRCNDPSCNKAFSYRSDLRKHLVIHSGLRPYVCPICFKAFTRSTNLNKHARVHSGRRPFACSNCDKMFATRGDLMRHALIHTGEKPYSCSICCVSFNRKDKLSRHEKLHNEQRAHMCSECPTSFNRKEELTKHVQFHHYLPETVYDGNLRNDVALNLVKNERSESNGSNYENREAESEDMIINVDPSHWADQKPECIHCNKTFTNQEELAKHAPIHEKSRDFICEICHKGFHQRRELVRHSLTHSGFKPFSCETCGKAFSRRDKLTRHKRTHSGTNRKDKQFFKEPPTCELCHKVYSSPHELTRHLLTHSLFKPYQCSLCTSSYCRKDKLVKHIKTTHPETWPESRP